VRNNAEYQATLLQIESVKRERDTMQEEGLALLDQLEGQGVALKETESAAVAEEGIFQGFQEEAGKVREKSQVGLDEVLGRRESKTGGIPLELMGRYERLFEVRDGLAVCAVERNVCQGCFTNITTNDMARLMGGSTMVFCGPCQRVLFLPE
jgi:predicted  nucleic acid-binding Zn-ribbon protein